MERNSAAALSPSPTGADTVKGFLRFVLQELKPKGNILTPFNIISGGIIAVGIVIIVIRFAFGLASVTNLSQDYPWGIWIGFDVVTGVAFAGGAYTLCFVVHILNFKKYEPILRATVLNGFLAYCFYAGALLLDLGRPWNVINPIIGNAFGYSSVLFLVAWHFLLYTICQFVEVFPAVTEWLYWPQVREALHHGRGHLRHHALHAPPVRPGRPVPDGLQQDPSAVVLDQHPAPVLRVERLRGDVDGDRGEHAQPPDIQGPDRPAPPRLLRRHPPGAGEGRPRRAIRLFLPQGDRPDPRPTLQPAGHPHGVLVSRGDDRRDPDPDDPLHGRNPQEQRAPRADHRRHHGDRCDPQP